MRIYADSSFIVKLLVLESDSEQASAEYRRLDNPKLPWLPLHDLEVHNAILLKTFHDRNRLPSHQRAQITRQKEMAQGRLQRLLSQGALQELEPDWNSAAIRARYLSNLYTEKLGTRIYDLLHVAFALELEYELLLTTDEQQAEVARREGLKVVDISRER